MLSTRFRTTEFLRFLFDFRLLLKTSPRVKTGIWLRATPSMVFPMINDLSKWPQWMASDPIHGAVKFDYGACRAGQDAELSWSSPQLSGSIVLLKSSGGRHIEFEMETGAGSAPGSSAVKPLRVHGSFDCRSEGVDTRLSWRCAWQPSLHPQLRVADLFTLWLIRRDFARGLATLKKLVESAGAKGV